MVFGTEENDNIVHDDIIIKDVDLSPEHIKLIHPFRAICVGGSMVNNNNNNEKCIEKTEA